MNRSKYNVCGLLWFKQIVGKIQNKLKEMPYPPQKKAKKKDA